MVKETPVGFAGTSVDGTDHRGDASGDADGIDALSDGVAAAGGDARPVLDGTGSSRGIGVDWMAEQAATARHAVIANVRPSVAMGARMTGPSVRGVRQRRDAIECRNVSSGRPPDRIHHATGHMALAAETDVREGGRED